MKPNPYQSPDSESKQPVPTFRSTWLDSLKLLIYGLAIGVPIALFVNAGFFRNFVLVTLRYYVQDLLEGR